MLSEKTGHPMDHQGFDDMSHAIGNGVTQKYLYELHNKIHKHQEQDIKLQKSKGDCLLSFLGFSSLKEFEHFLKHPIPEVLKSCESNWLSYVRQNSDLGKVYQSPVRIIEHDSRMYFQLQGKEHQYGGEITLSNGCLFTTFNTGIGKQFHHVYKIGIKKHPIVLQGTFSGVSTSGEPLGGRCVLIRSEKRLEELSNLELDIKALMESQEEEQKAIGNYFQDYHLNNLKIRPVMTYTISDLKNN